MGILSSEANKQTSSMQKVALATAEQTDTSKQLSIAMNDIRVRARELASGTTQLIKGVSRVAISAGAITSDIAKVRKSNSEQAENLSKIITALGPLNKEAH